MEGEPQKRRYGIGRWILFGVISLSLLATGAFLAQSLWRKTHHRYISPASGYFRGHVSASLKADAFDDNIFFSFYFGGESIPKWQWVWTTNFYYEKLEFEWWRLPSEGKGKIHLPSFTYELNHNHSTGALTQAVLSEWLLGKSNVSLTPKEAELTEAVLAFLQAAKAGTLPAPNHHGHYLDTPLSGRIMHFRVGRGVASYVYIWCAVWVLLTIGVAYKMRHYISHCKTIPDATKSNG